MRFATRRTSSAASIGTPRRNTGAAIVAEGEDRAAAEGEFGNGDGEPAEVRSLIQRVGIGDYLRPAAAGVGLTGVPAELAGALKVPVTGTSGGIAVPWRVLAGDAPEARQAPESRAFTTTGNNDGPTGQRPILQRLFGPGILDTLGVRMDTVPVGMSEWPLVATGVAPAQAKEGDAAAAAVAMTFNFATLKPKRLTGRYEYTHEARGVRGRPGTGDSARPGRCYQVLHVEPAHHVGGTYQSESAAHSRRRLPDEDCGAGRRERDGDLCRLCRARTPAASMAFTPRPNVRYRAWSVWTCTGTARPSIRQGAARAVPRR